MDEIQKALRLNPEAAKHLDMAKETLATLQELRAAGIAGTDSFRPAKGRLSLANLKPRKYTKDGIRLAFRA